MDIQTVRKKLSFKLGYDQIKVGEVENLTHDIMSALGITYKQTFVRRMNGGFFSPVEKDAITEIFSKYDVLNNIWTEL